MGLFEYGVLQYFQNIVRCVGKPVVSSLPGPRYRLGKSEAPVVGTVHRDMKECVYRYGPIALAYSMARLLEFRDLRLITDLLPPPLFSALGRGKRKTLAVSVYFLYSSSSLSGSCIGGLLTKSSLYPAKVCIIKGSCVTLLQNVILSPRQGTMSIVSLFAAMVGPTHDKQRLRGCHVLAKKVSLGTRSQLFSLIVLRDLLSANGS